jgi:uncharacterized protein YjbJ (UPF0337 family)
MKNSKQDKIEGVVHVAKGTVKEAAGKLMNNRTLEAKGNIEQAKGHLQSTVGDVKNAVKKTGDKIANDSRRPLR